MGAWGAGLYSSDMALDLRSAVAAVARLPFEENRLVEILCGLEPGAANQPDDEDHTVFWLVLADQFLKRGIVSPGLQEKALVIIDTGADLAMLEKLGMKPADLRKRGKTLGELRARIASAPTTSKPRSVIKEPQPYVMEIGGLYAYPTLGGDPINPYMSPKYFDRAAWRPDGFGLMLIIDRGRAFDYLTWYQSLVAAMAVPAKPDISALSPETYWTLELPGSCSAAHFKKMEMEQIGTLAIDPAAVGQVFPMRRPGTPYAIEDISIANRMTVGPKSRAGTGIARGEPYGTGFGARFARIQGLSAILTRSDTTAAAATTTGP
jgi:hypothetical protein